jgi:hypothetical protein
MYMATSWNEIKTRAAAFVNEWKDQAPAARESIIRKFRIVRMEGSRDFQREENVSLTAI